MILFRMRGIVIFLKISEIILESLALDAKDSANVRGVVLSEEKLFYVKERKRIYMKIRTDFVTNSSSSSFLICKKSLSEDQIEAIRHHSELGKLLGMDYPECIWDIRENDMFIVGDTAMDNFCMFDFLEEIGVPDSEVSWSEYSFELPTGEVMIDTTENPEWKRLLEKIKAGDSHES